MKTKKVATVSAILQNVPRKLDVSTRKLRKAETQKKTIQKLRKNPLENESVDEIYELFLELKKKKISENREGQKNKKKKNGIALKNVLISTPAIEKKSNKRKILLDFGISPIASSKEEIEENRAMKKLCDSFRKDRLKEIKEQEKLLETSAILRAKALLEKYKNPINKKRVELPQQDTRTIARRLTLNDTSLISFPTLSTQSQQIDESEENSNPNTNSISSENNLSNASQEEKNCENPDNILSVSKKQKVDHSELMNNKFMETFCEVVNKKSVNFVEPKVTMRRTLRSSTSKKSSILRVTISDEDESRVSIGNNSHNHPGKWKQALIEWRKTKSYGKSSLMNTIIHEEGQENDEEYQKANIYSNKIVETLGESVLLEQSDEGNLHAALSVLDGSIKCAATFHDQRKTSQRKTSVFERTSIFFGLQQPSSSLLIETNATPTSSTLPLTARQIALRRCGQQEPLPFDEAYAASQLPNCVKIGEGVFGEVFMFKCPSTNRPVVLKIIPIEGHLLVNGEAQKTFDEILQEIVISVELSELRHCKDNSTDGFVNVKNVTCVKGAYPQHLIDEWELFRENRPEGSENDHPEIFDENQLYIVFELCNGGRDLEAFIFNNAQEAQSVFFQTALTLAVAEQKFEFEHRDLHWGNILIAATTEKFVEYRLNGDVIKIPTHGVKVTIIDYSLSRMVYDGAILYDNLSKDEELFESTGDYQFDIYRLMRQRVDNDFERFEPFTNILWLHYIIDKLINGARYRYSKTKKHRSAINDLMQVRDELLNFPSSFAYVNHVNNGSNF